MKYCHVYSTYNSKPTERCDFVCYLGWKYPGCQRLSLQGFRLRPLTKSGSDRIGSDRIDKTWTGPDRTHKTRIGSDWIEKTRIRSVKVFPPLDQDDTINNKSTTFCWISPTFCGRDPSGKTKRNGA